MQRLVHDLIRAALGTTLALLPQTQSFAASAFGPSANAPVDYVLEKVEQHPVVLLGEAHWTRHDVELVVALVRPLAARGIVLAAEFWPAREQEQLDRLIGASEWDAAPAMRLMRAAAWPYREYLDILQECWRANREHPGSMRLIGLAPDER
jgi:heme-binding uptake protein ChaN (Tiki superfamily)